MPASFNEFPIIMSLIIKQITSLTLSIKAIIKVTKFK